MKKILFSVIILAVFALTACNSNKSGKNSAESKILEIEQLIENSDWEGARQKIDSIHILYRRQVDIRRQAVALDDTISRRESSFILHYCDSVLPLKQAEADSLQRFFRFEKDEKYQEVGNYIYKTQVTESNTNRNFLKCYVDEKANLYLVSQVVDVKLNQQHIKVSSGSSFVSTANDSLAKGDFHSFTTDGQYFESLTFTNADAGIAEFVASHVNDRLVVALSGSRNWEYVMQEYDKKAIQASYQLWMVKKNILKIEKEIHKAKTIIGNIDLRHSI